MLGRITVGLICLLLVWGNLVAGLKAGLACPDWPLCHGRVLPPFRLDIWMEFTHRIIAAVAGVFLLVLSWKRLAAYRGFFRVVPLAAVGILAIEIVLGGAVVLLEIPVQLTTLHFITGMTILMLAFYMKTYDGDRKPAAFSLRGYAALFFGMAVVVFFQAALGAYVRHADAGLACPDFPTCGGSWLPSGMTGPLLAHYSHRLGALLVFLTIGIICVAGFLDPGFSRHRKSLPILLLLCLCQIGVGAFVVLSGLNFAATALHLAIALAMIMLLFQVWTAEIRCKEDVP
jgi:heme a synthase